jgi:hypothetical protein
MCLPNVILKFLVKDLKTTDQLGLNTNRVLINIRSYNLDLSSYLRSWTAMWTTPWLSVLRWWHVGEDGGDSGVRQWRLPITDRTLEIGPLSRFSSPPMNLGSCADLGFYRAA